MNDHVTFIILDRKEYKESDALLVCYVKGVGVISMIARGANKVTSKYGSILQPLFEIEGLIDLRSNLSLFKSGRIAYRNEGFEHSLLALAVASFISKTLAINAMDDQHLITYENLLSYLKMINEANCFMVGSHFLSSIAQSHGMGLYLDGCIICNQSQISALSLARGGFLCPEHEANQPTILHEPALFKQLRCLSKAGVDELLKCVGPSLVTLMAVYVGLLEQIILIPHKNWEFIQEI